MCMVMEGTQVTRSHGGKPQQQRSAPTVACLVSMGPIGLVPRAPCRADDLAAAVKEDLERGLIPAFVCASLGTTSSAAVDDIAGLARVAQVRLGETRHRDCNTLVPVG